MSSHQLIDPGRDVGSDAEEELRNTPLPYHGDHGGDSDSESDYDDLVLYRRPQPRQRWIKDPDTGRFVSSLANATEERVATTNDLVLDLVYVVLLSRLGGVLRESLEVGAGLSVMTFLSLFIPIWWQWFATMGYLNRFDQEDGVHLLYFLGNLLIAVFCGIPIASCGEVDENDAGWHLTPMRAKNCANFAFPIAVGRFWVAGWWFYCFCLTPAKKKRANAVDKVTSAWPSVALGCMWMATALVLKFGGEALVHTGLPVAMWWTSIAADVLLTFLIRVPAYRGWFRPYCCAFEGKLSVNPVNVPLIVERQNLFLLLSLGEVLTAAVGKLDVHRHTVGQQESVYGTCLLVVVIGVLIKSLTFDLADRPSTSGMSCMKYGMHALATSASRGIAWTLLCLPLNACIVIVGAMLERLMEEAGGETEEPDDGHETDEPEDLPTVAMRQIWMLASALGVLCLLLTLHQLMHAGAGLRRVKKEVRVAVRVALSLLILLVPTFRSKDHWVRHPLAFLAAEIVLLLVLVAADAWMRTRTPAQHAEACAMHAAKHGRAATAPPRFAAMLGHDGDGGRDGGRDEGAGAPPRLGRANTMSIGEYYEAMH